MIDFSKKLKMTTKSKKTNPLEIYDSLDRGSTTGPLRPVQTRILEKWYAEEKDKRDLIIKLHTGAGKTLIGLLIALSYINSSNGPAVYVCPNVYLMQQACAEAKKFGIPYCIVSNNNELPNEFSEGKAVLISYVQKVFNGLSIFGIGNRSLDIGCIILDDSHACIDSMINACTIKVPNELAIYKQIVNIFENDLRAQGEGTFQDLLNGNASTVVPIPYWSWNDHITEVTSILSQNTDENGIKFAWPLLKDILVNCCAYVSADKIEISPICLPIYQFGVFNKATHRILMSATTQEDTFFIKGLGLSIDSIKNPLIDDRYTWSGEKMILIPDLICENADSFHIIKSLIQSEHDFGIAVLTPSFDKAEKYEALGGEIVNKRGNDVYATISGFKENYNNRTLVFANRYDGIDLPDKSCRVLIIDSLPYYDSLSDRYEEQCRSHSEIIKIKTVQKIEQGLGRSVRGEKDYSAILILGSDLIKYIKSFSIQKLFSPQTRKQVEIGFQIIEMTKEETKAHSIEEEVKLLFSTMNQCIFRDDGWKEYYASEMNSVEISANSKDELYHILQKEKEAFDCATSYNYDKAVTLVQEIVNNCTDDTEKGWYLQLAAKYQYHISHTTSDKLQVAAFKNNHQLLKPIDGITYNKIKYTIDVSRNQRILEFLNNYANYDELKIYLNEQLSNISFGVAAEKFEAAFYNLGKMLGYESQRPDKEIRKGPDVLWCASSGKYILVECKSEVLESREAITKSEAGQFEEHCGWFENEYGDASVLRIIVIPTAKLSRDAYFSREVGVLRKSNLAKLTKKVKDFFKEFRKCQFDSLNVDFIQEKLIAHKLCEDYFLNEFLDSPKQEN